jgi:hypothetical protein
MLQGAIEGGEMEKGDCVESELGGGILRNVRVLLLGIACMIRAGQDQCEGSGCERISERMVFIGTGCSGERVVALHEVILLV